MGVGPGLYMYDVVVKRSRSLSHLMMSSCHFLMCKISRVLSAHACSCIDAGVGLGVQSRLFVCLSVFPFIRALQENGLSYQHRSRYRPMFVSVIDNADITGSAKWH